MGRLFRACLSAVALLLATVPPSGADAPDPPWYGRDAAGQPQIHFYFFWSKSCPHCQAALPFVEDLAERHPWLVVHSHATDKPENVRLYIKLAKVFGQDARSVPAFMFCKQMSVGFGTAEETGRFLEERLEECYRQRQAAPPEHQESASSAPAAGPAATPILEAPPTVIYPPAHGGPARLPLSLPLYTLVIAGLDAFNPCAFFVLLFLLSLLVHARNRARMLFIGGVFVFFSGLIYFLFMAAWLNAFLLVGELRVVTLLAALIAIFIGLVNVKDFFWFKQGLSLSIPESAKPGLYQRMRGLLVADNLPALTLGTVTLAIAANTYELICTSGFPMLYTRLLTLEKLPGYAYYLYLVFYNVVYVLPLLAIVLIFTYTLGARKLQEHEGRLLKLLSGLMMLGLGIVLWFVPHLLNNLMLTGALLAVALGLTLLAYLWEKRRIST